MKRDPIILVDVDGVVADFESSILDFIFRHTGKRYSAEQILQWDVLVNFGLDHLSDLLEREINEDEFCTNILPFPGAHAALLDIQAITGVPVHFATAPYHAVTWPGERIAWLRNKFGSSHRHIHLTHEKHMLQGDVLIDDSLKNCLSYAVHHPDARVFLWSKPYNQTSECLPSNVQRTSAWSDIITYVRGRWGTSEL